MNFENIHNYYEKLVIDYLLDHVAGGKRGGTTSQDYLEDVACVALNRLPTRYVRYDVDTAFYMSDEDRQTMRNQVEVAVGDALRYVDDHRAAHNAG